MFALIIIVAALAAIGWWRISLRFWPTAKCRKCGGDGRNLGSNSDRWGKCRRCGGSGKRTRFGVRDQSL